MVDKTSDAKRIDNSQSVHNSHDTDETDSKLATHDGDLRLMTADDSRDGSGDDDGNDRAHVVFAG